VVACVRACVCVCFSTRGLELIFHGVRRRSCSYCERIGEDEPAGSVKGGKGWRTRGRLRCNEFPLEIFFTGVSA
jgi:hypothetical protein